MNLTVERRPKRGSVQVHTYERVEALVKLGRTKRSAIDTIAAQSGRSVAAVQAAYYAEARRRRPPLEASRLRRPARPVPRAGTAAGLDDVLDELVASVERLARVVHAERP